MGVSSNGKDADRDGGIIAANFGGVWHFNREKSAMRGPYFLAHGDGGRKRCKSGKPRLDLLWSQWLIFLRRIGFRDASS